MNAHKIALLFPGQGSQSLAMLDALRALPGFEKRYSVVCSCLQLDPIEQIQQQNPDLINANAVSSALTVLAGVLALDEYRRTSSQPAAIVSGYSVGQWTALYAAGVVTFEKLIEIITYRASLMDNCSAKRPGGMLAVIGIAPEPLLELCQQLTSNDQSIGISNYNCYGQYTLSGDVALIDRAQDEITKMSPKRLLRVPVAGAWHSPILDEAALLFGNFLQTCDLHPPVVQVIDNVNGDYLSQDKEFMVATLTKHISHPVQWHKGMLRMLADGVTECVEIGYGNTLTKFGMFIDRSIEHKQFFPSPVAV